MTAGGARPAVLRTVARWVAGLGSGLMLYGLSSGPVLATAFWLREHTGWDGFYLVLYPYAPLIAAGRSGPVDAYIEWWVYLFGTVGPG